MLSLASPGVTRLAETQDLIGTSQLVARSPEPKERGAVRCGATVQGRQAGRQAGYVGAGHTNQN